MTTSLSILILNMFYTPSKLNIDFVFSFYLNYKFINYLII